MAKHGTWTVVFSDKIIVKRTGEFNIETAKGLTVEDDTFWNQSKFNGLHAIQFTNDNIDNDQVEFIDKTNKNTSYSESIYGDFSQFISRWDSAYLVVLQNDWDSDVLTVSNENFGKVGELAIREETLEEQVVRKGLRPTNYTS